MAPSPGKGSLSGIFKILYITIFVLFLHSANTSRNRDHLVINKIITLCTNTHYLCFGFLYQSIELDHDHNAAKHREHVEERQETGQ